MIELNDRRFNQLALSSLAAGFLLLLAALFTMVAALSNNQRSVESVRHTYDVVAQLSVLEVELERAEAGRRGFLISQSDYRRKVYEDNARLAPATLDRLAALVQDNRLQTGRVAQVRRLLALQLADMGRSVSLAAAGQSALATREFNAASDSTLIRRIRAVTGSMRETEYRLLAERSERERSSLVLLEAVLAITGLLLIAVGGSAFWLVRRYTIDLTRTRDRLALLNTDLEAAVAERTADLQKANEEIQRFAYIVSHDLRSPLVNILGFTAELNATDKAISSLIDRADEVAPGIVTDDAREARRDLEEATGFIRSSAQKMDRLINAILKISREGRRALVPERLSVQRLAEDVISGVGHRAAEAGATIEIEGELPEIVSDRLAVEQIFSNLVENALKYARPGRSPEIRIRGRHEGNRATFEIQDNGRGIDSKDLERVFELFRRAGPQDQQGEGIGLAHVRALAYRLGGTVTVQSALGEGSTFRLSLPTTFDTQGASN